MGKSLALAMVRPEHGAIGTELDIQILGERKRATVIEESPYDPENARLRAQDWRAMRQEGQLSFITQLITLWATKDKSAVRKSQPQSTATR